MPMEWHDSKMYLKFKADTKNIQPLDLQILISYNKGFCLHIDKYQFFLHEFSEYYLFQVTI